MDPEFYFQPVNNLTNYLYDIESEFAKVESAKNFDSIDIIFILGHDSSLPWGKNNIKLRLLLK